MKKYLLSSEKVNALAGKVFFTMLMASLFLGLAQKVSAQCTIDQVAPCPDEPITGCADHSVGGYYGSTLIWTPPDYELDCGGTSGGYNWVMLFDIPESQSSCWIFNLVQRVGNNGGQLRLNQSSGTGLPSFVTPAFLFSGPTSCAVDISAEVNFTMRVYYADDNGIALSTTPAATVVVNAGVGVQNISFQLDDPPSINYYRLKFEFTGVTGNKSFVDNLMIDALISGSACTGDINFYTTSSVTPSIPGTLTHTGTFFPAGNYTITYTAYYNDGSNTTSESCSFSATVNEVTASVFTTPADCGNNNGSITIHAQSTPTALSYEYSLNNGAWTTFSSPLTIYNLVADNYNVNVRANFASGGTCYIQSQLTAVVGLNVDQTPPAINCPAELNLIGCDITAITVANSGLSYSSTETTITPAQFAATGATATDACGIVTYKYKDTQSGTCPLIITRTFTVIDNSGNSSNCNQIIRISDNTAPTWLTEAGALNRTVECSDASGLAAAQALYPVATDDCDSDVTNIVKISGAFVSGGECSQEGTYTNTWTVTDACGNTSAVYTQVISIIDESVPVITVPSENLTMSCFDASLVAAWAATASAVDNCSGSLPVTPTYTAPTGNCNQVITVTFTATDACGNVGTATKNFTVNDDEDPIITLPSTDLTLDCFDASAVAAWAATASAVDNCSGSLPVTPTYTAPTGNCNQVITVTFTATDACGNVGTATKSFTVNDDEAPIITLPSTDLTLDCYDEEVVAAWAATASAMDNCSGVVAVTPSYTVPTGSCNVPVLVTFTATDACGNMATATKSFIVNDDVAPVVTVPSTNLTLTCYDPDAVAAWAATASATDNCGAEVTVMPTYTAPTGSCNAEVIVTFSATDVCGNTGTTTKSFIVNDNIDPVLQGVPADVTVACESVPAPAIVTATDNCDTEVTVTYNEVRTDGSCPNTYTLRRTWTATDDCNNQASATQVITVQDIVPPVITLPSEPLTMECFDADLVAAWAATAYATDACDDNVTVVPTYTAPTGNCDKEITVTFTATDDCGNTATAYKSFTVDDNTAPVVTVPSGTLNLSCYDASAVATWAATASAWDNCSGSLPVLPTYTAPIGNCDQEITVTFTATDACGNVGTATKSFTVNDEIAPVIYAPEPLQIVCDLSSDPSAEINSWLNSAYATDNCDNEILVTNDFEGYTQECNGTTIITFYSQDVCGNEASPVTSTITFIDEIEPVVINEPGELDATVECSDPEALAEALLLLPTAIDNCTAVPEINLVSDETISNEECENVYTRIRVWNFTDDCGNVSANYIQTINVIDNTLPVWTVEPTDLTVECNGQGNLDNLENWLYSFSGTDNCGEAVVTNNFTGINELCGSTGSATVIFTLSDECGNSIEATATFTILDTIAPVFTEIPADITVECSGDFDIDTPVAVDNCSENVEVLYLGEVRTDGNCENNYTLTRTWSATDDCGNVSTCTQVITVQDITDPVFTYVPENVTVECDEIPEVETPTATDNCDTDIVIAYEGEEVITGECPANYTIIRTWTATDNCENVATATQTITVNDVTPPVFTVIPQDLTVECDGLGYETILQNWLNSAVATDNCGTVTITNNYTGLSGGCGNTGTATVTFTANDGCGNISTTSATFTVTDSEGPTMIVPANIYTNNDPGVCGAQVSIPVVTAYDNCGSATVTNNITGTNNASGYYEVGSTTIIWTATDECGNTTTGQTIVKVYDEEAPHIICPPHMTVFADPGVCEAYIDVPQPIVTDNCEIRKVVNTWTQTDDASGVYPVGTTIVWWTVVDMSGNTDNCFMNITVIDDEDPTIICPEDITVNTNPGVCEALITIPTPEANDNCGIESLVNSFNGTADASGIYPVGTTTVTWTATDLSGNSVTCTMTVTVNDNEIPTIICPENIVVNSDEGECGANVTVPQPVMDDNCGIENFVNSFTGINDASAFYPVGTTEVTWTVTDIHGNSATCIMSVVVKDQEHPTIICPTDITINNEEGQCGATVEIPAPEVDDNCGIESVVNSFNNTADASGFYPAGVTVVTWTVTDIHGNEAICEMTVTVNDTEPPVIICPDNVEVVAGVDCNATIEIPEPEVTDNCGVLNFVNDFTNTGNASGVYPAGITTVTWTVTDVNGNTTTCSIIVNVIAAPIAVDDYAITELNTQVVIPVLNNDTDCDNNLDPASVTNITDPANGTVVVDPLTGNFTYTPNTGFLGEDEFTYRVCDADGLCDEATVYITVTSALIAVDDEYTTEVNTAVEIINLANDSYVPYSPVITILEAPKHGTVDLHADYTVTYTPNLDWIGEDTYTYILSDINGVAQPDTAITTINVIPAVTRDTLIIYNIITPDNDGYNDVWYIEGIEEYPDNEVLIFNRWGDQIRQFDRYNNTTVVWDGNNKFGDKLPAATYYYIIRLRSINKVYTGWVVIHSHNGK